MTRPRFALPQVRPCIEFLLARRSTYKLNRLARRVRRIEPQLYCVAVLVGHHNNVFGFIRHLRSRSLVARLARQRLAGKQ